MNKINDKKINESLKIMRALCGPMRFKIIYLLHKNKKGLSVTEIAEILHGSLSRISHQLSILKAHKMVRSSGQNRETIYKLGDHGLVKYISILF
jgi:DNA-binding transcriptional ArsR family regulator